MGAFGWMLSNPEGDIAASAMGPARGAKMDSYRAECTGMLSLLRFLFRLGHYSHMDALWRGVIGTDNQSMLDRLYKADPTNSRKQLASLDVMDPEWDLLMEIQESLREMPGVTLTYVKGHQDDRTEYGRLPLLAQLNVDADRLAGRYNREHGARRPFSFMAPNTGALLVTNDGTLTAKFSSELRIRSTSPGLEEYIRTKNDWDKCIFDTVNWQAHGKAFKQSLPKRVHLTKFIHDALPTHHQANLMDGGTRRCLACKTCDEMADHILRCSENARSEWRRTTFWREVDAFHQNFETHPLLRYVFREGMMAWLDPGADDSISPILFPQEVRRLISSQNAIGWRQIFRGRFSLEWQAIQNEYYLKHKRKSSYKRTGDRWQQQFIKVIWEAWYQLWSLRNGEVHGNTAATRVQAQRREVERQLTDISASRGFMEPEVRVLLAEDGEHQSQQPTIVTQNWLAMAGPVIRKSVRESRKRLYKGFHH